LGAAGTSDKQGAPFPRRFRIPVSTLGTPRPGWRSRICPSTGCWTTSSSVRASGAG